MARTSFGQQNFNAGELSPRLWSRSDIQQYSRGLRTATNVQVLEHGPVKRRNGTQYIAEVKDSSKAVRLVPFEFSAGDSFILEFGESYIRFYTSKAQVTDGGSPVEVTTPYSESELTDLQFAQNGNKLYIVHPSYQPRVLTRSSTIQWDLNTFEAFPPVTEELGLVGAGSVTPSATSGSITLTNDTAEFVQADVGRQFIVTSLGRTGRASITGYTSTTVLSAEVISDFDSTTAFDSGDWKLDLSPLAEATASVQYAGEYGDITFDDIGTSTAIDTIQHITDTGKYIYLNDGVAEIQGISGGSDKTTADVIILKSLSSLDETANWTLQEAAWSTSRGYPRAVGFFDQRLVFGGTDAEPQTLWFSEAGIYDGFGTGSLDSDSIELDIVSTSTNQISWIAASRDLIVGTSGAECTVSSSSGILTPSSLQQRARTYHGSNNQQIEQVGDEILFIQKSGRKLRNFFYDFEVDGYRGRDMMILCEHLTADPADTIKEITYVQDPDSLIFVVLDSGTMLCSTYNRAQEVLGWTKWTTDGTFENVSSISDDNQDQVYVVVNRTIDGNTVRYIEVVDNSNSYNSDLAGFSDSFLTYDSTATDTITGLDHLEGETVQVKVEGATHPDCVVSSGSITLNADYAQVVVGLSYTSTIETLDLELKDPRRSFLTQAVYWTEPRLRIYRSTNPVVNGQSKPRRNPSMEMDQKPDLFSGDLIYERVDSPRLSITCSQPFDMIITGIFGTVEGEY